MSGIELGDIGPKYGFQAKDNGYMIFNNFKLAKDALLSKYITITADGDLQPKGDPRVAYSTMMLIRIQLVEGAPAYIFKPLMIALRYAYIRRQFRTIPGSNEERRILDYQATQVRFTTALAFAWVSKFSGYKATSMYHRMIDEIKNKNKFKVMKDLHSFLCALKAYYMEECLIRVKDIRECMGGHGYLNVNEVTELIDMMAPNVTLEGDGCVMYQQTAKDIFKSVGRMVKGKKIKGSYEYLMEMGEHLDATIGDKDLTDLKVLIEIIKVATIHQIIKVGNKLRKKVSGTFARES